MARVPNNLLLLATRDLEASKIILSSTNDELMQNIAAYHTQQAVEKILKHLKIENGDNAGIGHDIKVLANEASALGAAIPEWVIDGAYDLSSWATTIRYNSNFKTNAETIEQYNDFTKKWIEELSK